MVLVVEGVEQPLLDTALRSMFAARKRVFVDLLKWDVPVLEGQYELDQFDNEHAVYLILRDEAGQHLASARLLPTDRPHLLDTLFPGLCDGTPPRGADVLEITRFCLDRSLGAAGRLHARNCLVSAIADYAIERGVTAYTGVAEMGWLQQILAFGWACRPLGLPKPVDGRLVGALRIDIGPNTPALLAWNGIYVATALGLADALEAA
jgi:N-acyl-L-homoserine lactone synthetase